MPIRTNRKSIASRPDIASAKPPERSEVQRRRSGALEPPRPEASPPAAHPTRPGPVAPPFSLISPTRGRTTLARSHTRPKAREETSGFPSLAVVSIAGRWASKVLFARFAANSWHANADDQGRQLLVSTRISEREHRPRSLRPGAAPLGEQLGTDAGRRSFSFSPVPRHTELSAIWAKVECPCAARQKKKKSFCRNSRAECTPPGGYRRITGPGARWGLL